MLGTCEGRKPAGHGEAAWISARSHAITNEKLILRPRKKFENFVEKLAENRTQSRAPHLNDARHRCWRPLRVMSQLGTARRYGFRRDLTRFRTQNFCGHKNFGPKSAPNRMQSHTPQHADARNRCWGPLRVMIKLRTTRRHGFRRDLARFRTQNFAAAKIFENFGPKSAPNRTKSHAAQHADARHCCL